MIESSWSGLGTTIASLMFLWTMVHQYLPYQFDQNMAKYAQKLLGYIYPYIEIKIHEYTGDRVKRSDAYATIKTYLSANSGKRAKKLKAEIGKDSSNLVVSMDEHEQVTDEFRGATVWWSANMKIARSQSISIYPGEGEQNYYQLTFHRRHRELIMDHYLAYVMEEGKAVAVRNRQRKLYTNNPSQNWYGYKKSVWSHDIFDHPATFNTLAMDHDEKQEIIDDLVAFSKGKDYYRKIGKAWKRGYLLYGPPGTGKSTMIAAMANYLDYDVYDLELTAVKNNTELKKLLIEATNKSIIVIEDIDCSLDLSGKRKKEEKQKDDEEEEKNLPGKPDKEESSSKVTLSGLLNFIDGLWSSCGGERLIVFTTNYVEKLDPALIRKGRMDKHIELSYCSFQGFEVLAKNYLDLDSHPLFETIRQMMEETNITPADVAEHLMHKSTNEERNATTCLEDLIQSLHKLKEEMKSKEAAAQLEVKSKATALQPKENGSIEKTVVENGDTSKEES